LLGKASAKFSTYAVISGLLRLYSGFQFVVVN
jgi:hypothetical protein